VNHIQDSRKFTEDLNRYFRDTKSKQVPLSTLNNQQISPSKAFKQKSFSARNLHMKTMPYPVLCCCIDSFIFICRRGSTHTSFDRTYMLALHFRSPEDKSFDVYRLRPTLTSFDHIHLDFNGQGC
jgi:hypothetical protein